MSEFVQSGDDPRQRRMQQILDLVVDEAMEEIGPMDETLLAAWFHNMASVIEWCATGNLSVLPPEVVPFAAKVDGRDPSSYPQTEDDSSQETLALVSSADSIAVPVGLE